jgi:hypothetical protein
MNFLYQLFYNKKIFLFNIKKIYFFFYFLFLDVKIPGRSRLINKSKSMYSVTSDGFLIPIRLFLSYSFGHFDDFIIIASMLKRETT